MLRRSSVLFAIFAVAACGSEDGESPDTGTVIPPDGGMVIADTGTATTADAGVADAGEGVDATTGPMTQRFRVRIENVSDNSALPTGFSPGVWAVHESATPLFERDTADKGEGLEALAEDGDPAAIATSAAQNMAVSSSGVFDTPTGAMGAGPLMPGQSYEFEVEASSDSPSLSFASMLIESNDLFIAPSATGLALFGQDGQPIPETDVTDMITLWDLGTETNEAPGAGPNQPARQADVNTGSPESVVHLFTGSTRALPLARDIVEFSVLKTGDATIEITVTNDSASKGAFQTSISAAFWAIHADIWTMFTPGMSASMGLEALAEDGVPNMLETEHGQALGVAMARAEMGKAGPGESYNFSVTANVNQPLLSLAIGLSETNDAFLSFGPEGISLLDEMGQLRPEADIAADLNTRVIVWDAGTERNEAPGIGLNQSARQIGSTGEVDPDSAIRPFFDSGNDLAGSRAGGVVDLTIQGDQGGDFTITLANTSGNTLYPTMMSPLAYVLHDGTLKVFTDGSPASMELERLAEDGDPNGLKGTLNALPTATSEIVRTPEGAGAVGPILPGERYVFSVTPTAMQPAFNLFSMVGDSNDAFVSLGPTGILLLDQQGNPRGDVEIAADISMFLRAWDAGTEGNQSGGAGPDQLPRQPALDRGPPEGAGRVEAFQGRVWSYPAVSEVIRVTVTPI